MTVVVDVSVELELPDGHKITLTREQAEELYRALDVALHGSDREPPSQPESMPSW